MVSLVPATKLKLVQIEARDRRGRPHRRLRPALNANQPGGNYVATVTKNGATPAAMASPAARAVDAVIEGHASAVAVRSRRLARLGQH